MKIRYGFVSNSSSSSFTCDVCGEEQSGMDMCLSDAGMMRCNNDHTFCKTHKIKSDVTVAEMREDLKRSKRNTPGKSPKRLLLIKL